MKNATMLYRCPGPHSTDGVAYAYTIVDEADVEATLAEGWHRDWIAADAAMKAAAAKLAANEAEQQEVDKQLQAAEQPARKGRKGG